MPTVSLLTALRSQVFEVPGNRPGAGSDDPAVDFLAAPMR